MEKLDFHRSIATRGKVDYMGTDTGDGRCDGREEREFWQFEKRGSTKIIKESGRVNSQGNTVQLPNS